MNIYKYFTIIFAIILFVLLKFWYAQASISEVLFLLKPTDFFIGIFTSSISVFNSEIGFFNEELNIIINKSCSGFNFLVLSFLMLVFLFFKANNTAKYSFLSIPISLFISYIITIFVNSARILFSLNMNKFSGNRFSWLHQVEGTFVYLFFLIIVYFIFNQLFTKFRNEKFA